MKRFQAEDNIWTSGEDEKVGGGVTIKKKYQITNTGNNVKG